MYVTADDIYAATKLDSSVVSESAVNSFIKAAEKYIDRFTFTTYWAVESDEQEVDSATDNTVTVSGTPYTADALIGMYVWVYSGTGSGQIRKITDNTTSSITVESDWSTNPVSADLFRIIYTASDPHLIESVDGNDEKYFFLPEYPIRLINSLTIDDDSVTVSSLYQYEKTGKIQLSNTSEKSRFVDWKPQTIDLDYWWGVYPMTEDVKRAVIVLASMYTLAAQTGGTYNVPSTYSLPEGSVTIGQAYVNIRETYNMLGKEWQAFQTTLIRYPRSV